MDLNQLLYFRSVAHLGNVSRAAELHYTSQSCISKSISRLERELGTKLFTRVRGRLELNEEGKAFLKTVEESVACLQKGLNDLARPKAGRRQVSLSCTMNFRVDPILVELARSDPDLSIKVVEYGYSQLDRGFDRKEIDLAIVSRPYTHEGVVCQRIALVDSYLVVHKEHPLAGEAEVSLTQLDRDVFLCDLTGVDKEMFLAACSSFGFLPDIRFEVKNSASALRLLRENLCVAVLPAFGLLCHSGEAGDLRLVKIREKLPPTYVGIVYSDANRALIATPAYRKIIDLIFRQVQDDIRAGQALWMAHHPGAAERNEGGRAR